jgi:ABC-type transport system substrate-binding protein
MADSAGAVTQTKPSQGAIFGNHSIYAGGIRALCITGGMTNEGHAARAQVIPDPLEPIGAAVEINNIDWDILRHARLWGDFCLRRICHESGCWGKQ